MELQDRDDHHAASRTDPDPDPDLEAGSALVGRSLADLDGRLLRGNQALCRLLGRSQDELLAATFADVTHVDDVRADHHALARLHRTPDEPCRSSSGTSARTARCCRGS